MQLNDPLQEITKIKEAVFGGLEEEKWKGWDPFDGLNSPFSRWTLNKKWLAIACLQAVKRSPFNLRPFLKIAPQENAMTWAAGLLGALEGWKREQKPSLAFIERAAQRLIDLSDPKYALWGYPFPWASKAFTLNPREPNLVISSLCLKALAKTILSLKDQTPKKEIWKNHYKKAADNLWNIFFKPDAGYFSYVAHEAVLVHNANLLGAEAVAYAKSLGVELSVEREKKTREALQKTLSAQSPAGRWAYGTRPHHQWCDNFHTAYNLVALSEIYSLTQDPQIPAAIGKGLEFYLSHAFTESGEARYYDKNTWPLETHSAAAALICLGEMAKNNWLGKEKAQKQALKIWVALKKRAYLGGGNFIYREGRFWKVRTVFNRWTQSWVYYGLESFLSLFSTAEIHRK